MTDFVHIASLLVQARVDARERAMQALPQQARAEIHVAPGSGKFVAVLECAHERDIAACIEAVQAVPGVISVSMVAHYIEDAALLAEEMPQ